MRKELKRQKDVRQKNQTRKGRRRICLSLWVMFGFVFPSKMPITCPAFGIPLSQDEFARIDYDVMRLVFESQNSLGRLCDEVIYQNDLSMRLRQTGKAQVLTEVPIVVSHLNFVKKYSVDLLLQQSAVYELKTAGTLIPEHEAQLLNYLFLSGARHGKLLNFRPAQVQTRFVNTNLTPEIRKRFQVNTDRWNQCDDRDACLPTMFVDLVADWGLFLELALYMEALTHFFGGEEHVVKPISLSRNGVPLGNQKMHLITNGVAFRLTALADTQYYEQQLLRLLHYSTLQTIHWINMDRHDIHFITLKK